MLHAMTAFFHARARLTRLLYFIYRNFAVRVAAYKNISADYGFYALADTAR